MQSGQLHHLEFYVDDLSRSNLFWGWFLPFMGYAEFQQWTGGRSWKHPTGTYLVFVQIDDKEFAGRNDRRSRGLNHLAFIEQDLTRFNNIRLELENRKLNVTREKNGYFCFEDPNDFAVEVYLSE